MQECARGMCKQVVQGIYIAAIQMMRIMNVLQFIKLSLVNVMCLC